MAMRSRCVLKNTRFYKGYADRGITVCDRWSVFVNFLEDMGERPEGLTLERRDNDKGYDKENCYWATNKQQMRNRRRTLKVTWKGKERSLSEWCELLGINYQTAFARLRDGKPISYVLDQKKHTLFSDNNPRSKYITFKGRTMNIQQWANEFDIFAGTLAYRINKGWGIEEALTTPVK